MSVKTFDPGASDGGADNWKVAQRLVDAFAPHAQNEPTMSVVVDQGALLDGTTLTEVATQIVGPFSAPTSGHRVDRIVIDRATGSASIVVGTDGSLVPPAIPDGALPIARVLLNDGTVQVTNDILFDERAPFDLGPSINDNLTALSELDSTPGLVEQTGAATFTKRAIGAASGGDVPTRDDADTRYVLKSGDAMTGALTLPGDPNADLEATPKQYVDREIADAVAAITPASIGAADARITVTGSGLLTGGGDLTADRVISMADIATLSVIGRTDAGTGAPSAIATPMIDVITAADASDARDVLELGDAATHDVGVATGTDIPTRDGADTRYLLKSGDAMAGALTLAADPAAALEAATKQYVDNLAAGFDVKASVKAASVAELTLYGEQNVNNVALSSGDRVLAKNQTVAADNGVYVVASGAWSRSDDMASWSQLPGAFLFVEQGDVGADTGWVCTVDQGGTIGADAIVFSQFAGVGAFAPLSRQILSGTGLSGGGDLSADRTLSLADTAVAPGSYGSATSVAGFTVDQQGRLTAATDIAVTPAAIGAQAESDELDALATISTTGLLVRDGAASATTRSIEGSGVIAVTDGDGVAGDPTIATSMSSGALLGRSSAGTGEAEEIALGSGLTLDAGVLSAAGGTADVTQSGPTYLASGDSTTVTGKSVLTAYEQIAGQTFDLTYNTEADFAQQDAANGTDLSAGRFVLHNTAGAEIDAYTKLLIHADGVNGSTEIIDNRNITPFGTNCGYFDGTAYYQVPSSYKMAFGATQDLTVEGWFYLAEGGSWQTILQSGDGLLYIGVNTYNALQIKCGGATSSLSTLTVGQWYHVAIVRHGGTVTAYLSGVSAGTPVTGALSATSLFIGSINTASEHLKGWMSNIRVSKVARYTTDFTPPTAAFTRDDDTVYLFHFDDGHGSQFLRDASESGHEVALIGTGSLTNSSSVFGATCLDLSNGGVAVGATKPTSVFAIGAEDFTIDLWVYPRSTTGTVLGQGVNSSDKTFGINIAGGNFVLYASSNNATYDVGFGSVITAATLNTWQHIAVTMSGTTLRIFKNGILAGSYAVASSQVFWNTQAAPRFYVGMVYTGGYSNMLVDEVRIQRGVAEWTESFTPPTAPHTADDRTILLCHFEGANGDQVTLDRSESSYGNAEISSSTIPVLTFEGGAALSAAQNRGGHGTSLYLDGTNDNASLSIGANDLIVGYPLRLGGSSDHFCIEGWFYNSPGTTGTLMSLDDTTASSVRYYVYKTGASSVAATIRAPGDVHLTAGSFTASAWNHVALVREARGYVLYINGVATASAAYAAADISYTTGHIHTFRIGDARFADPFNGQVDSVRITNGKPRYTANFTPGDLVQDDDTAMLWVFDGSVGETWVKELSKNTAIIKSTNARTVKDGRYVKPILTGSNASINTSVVKFGSGSLSCNGTASNYYTIPHQDAFCPQGDYTFEAWIKPTTTGAPKYILAKDGSTNASSCFQWLVLADDKVQFNHFSGANYQAVASSSALSTSAFSHVAVVRSGSTLTMYVNGVQVSTAGTSGPMNIVATAPLTIGAHFAATAPFNGHIDEIRISDTARWTSDFAVPTIPYGEQYVSGTYWVATKPGTSSLDLTAFTSVDAATITQDTPPGTTLTYLISTDGYASALKRWNGSAWVDTAYSMSWDGSALTTAATAAQLNAVGNTATELRTGLAALDTASVGSLNVVAMLATGNATFTPALDDIQLVMDEYTLLRPVTDYTVSRRKATGEQTLTITRVKSGNANHVFDVV